MKQRKKCRTCNKVRIISLFHKHKGRKDGLRDSCKPCYIKYITEWKANKVEEAL